MHVPTRLEELAQQLLRTPNSYKLVVEELYRVATWVRKSGQEYAPRIDYANKNEREPDHS